MALKNWQARDSKDEDWEALLDYGNGIEEIDGCGVLHLYSLGYKWRVAFPLAEGRHAEVFLGGTFYPSGRTVDPNAPHGYMELRWCGEGVPPPAGDPARFSSAEFGSFVAAVRELDEGFISMGKEIPQPMVRDTTPSRDPRPFHRTLNRGD